MVPGLTLAAYAHPGFFAYGSLYLILDAFVARNRGAVIRAIVAIGTAVVASLPLTLESWLYPDLFQFNNVAYAPTTAIDWASVARSIYYNVELLVLPWRWFNDFAGLTLVLLPVAAVLVWFDRSRVRFYAVALLFTVGLMRLHNPYTGYVLLRPLHMLPSWSHPSSPC